jgi:hypothetical protein
LKYKVSRISGRRRLALNEEGPPSTAYTPYDGRSGGGYGTVNPKFDISYQRGDIYPYVKPPVDDDEEVDCPFEEDPEALDKFVSMVNLGAFRNDPSRRADRASFVSNQRIRIPESGTAMRKGDSLYGTMSPIPKKSLYGSFDGPALGGSSTNVAFNPGTYKRTGTQYGTSRAPLYLGSIDDDPSEDMSAYTLEDILYPDDKAVARAMISVQKQKKQSKS